MELTRIKKRRRLIMILLVIGFFVCYLCSGVSERPISLISFYGQKLCILAFIILIIIGRRNDQIIRMGKICEEQKPFNNNPQVVKLWKKMNSIYTEWMDLKRKRRKIIFLKVLGIVIMCTLEIIDIVCLENMREIVRDFELFQFLGFPLLFIIPLIFLVPICYFLNVKELNEKISDLEVQYSRLSNEYEDTKRLQDILVGNATDSKQVKEVYQVELHKFIDDLKIKLGERYVTYPKTFEVVEDTAMSYLKQHVLSKGNLYNHNSDFQNCYNEIQKNGLIEIEEEEAFTERMRLKTLPDRMKHQISNIGFYLRLIDHEILDREIYEPKAYDSDVDLYLKDKVIDDYLLFDDYGGIARKYPDIEDELDEFSKKLDAAIAVNKFENTY